MQGMEKVKGEEQRLHIRSRRGITLPSKTLKIKTSEQ